MSLRLVRISNQWDPRIEQFRREVCAQLGADPGYFDLRLTYNETFRRFQELPETDVEELWKFGRAKWEQTQFSNLECVLDEEKVVSISGCRMYREEMLRVAMHLYTLPSHRGFVRNFQFRPDGFFARHVEFAKSSTDASCLFLTVYPHNSRLVSHVRNLAHRRISPGGGPMQFIQDLEFIAEPIEFHGVSQYFFLYKLKPDFEFNGQAPECI